MKLFSGNLIVHTNDLLRVDDQIELHEHTFPHTALVFQGGVIAKLYHKDGREETHNLTAPAYFEVPAGARHSIKATAANTQVWCVFQPRDPTTYETVPVYNGWLGATQ